MVGGRDGLSENSRFDGGSVVSGAPPIVFLVNTQEREPIMNPTLNSIDIVVSDLEAAMAFYALLGLDFKVDEHSPEHAACDLPNGLHVMLDTVAFRTPFLPGWTKPSGGPGTLLCFEFPGPAGVDAKYAELVQEGYRGHAAPFDAFWGMRYATVLDPDGNGIDLYAPLEVSA